MATWRVDVVSCRVHDSFIACYGILTRNNTRIDQKGIHVLFLSTLWPKSVTVAFWDVHWSIREEWDWFNSRICYEYNVVWNKFSYFENYHLIPINKSCKSIYVILLQLYVIIFFIVYDKFDAQKKIPMLWLLVEYNRDAMVA